MEKAKALFKKPVRVLAVGKSGVGKSSIGNCLLTGKRKGDFHTSKSPESCTQESQWANTDECFYCDVPGIPDTNPKNTAKFYDIIIEEARKKLTAVLFVFKYERIDEDVYDKAKMLFRELTKTKAVKVLVINDMNFYDEDEDEEPPTEEHYRKLEKAIAKGTGLTFEHKIVVRKQTMKKNLEHLKSSLADSPAHLSPKLKTFVELKKYVDELQDDKNREQEVYNDAVAKIEEIKNNISTAEAVIAGAATATAVASGLALISFGFTLGVAGATVGTAAAAVTALEVYKAQLSIAESEISKEKLEEAAKLLKEACDSFKKLEAALGVQEESK